MAAFKSKIFMFLAFCVNVLIMAQNDPNWCGNKHANLVKLQTIVQSVVDVEVPEFMGISTGRIEAFLRKHAPQIFNKYSFVVKRLNGKKTPFSRILNAFSRLNYLSNERILEQIQNDIKECFNCHYFDFDQSEIQMIDQWRNDKQFCMVRSTGVEDSQTIANAGGNVSIAYVNSYTYEIKQAMGEVVASYFGMQSLKNRIAGGEILSSTDVCLPVLIQLLIGESVGGSSNPQEIPVSGVAFTTNQGLSAPNFSITEINASFGHGEGIVANKVIADRYYVTTSKIDSSLSIYPMIYQKTFRLIPSNLENVPGSTAPNGRGLMLVSFNNPRELTHTSALSQLQIKSLYHALKTIESSYGQPMDVEFVVVGSTVYIVQARPAMRHVATPSYLKIEQLSEEDISKPLQVMTLVPGNAQLLVITNPADILIANTLDEADQMPNNAAAKAVIVHAWASSLSHAAVNFISHGIPCLYVQNKNELSQLIAQVSTKKPLIIDSQRRIVALWNSEEPIQECIAHGWFEHPIDRAYSFMSDKEMSVVATGMSLPVDARLLILLDSFKKTQNPADQKKIIAEIVDRVTKRLALTSRRIAHLKLINSDIHKALDAFKMTFDKIIAELSYGIDQGSDHFELLFYHKILEALLFQDSSGQPVLGAFTYTYFLNDLFGSQTLLALMRQANNNKELNKLISYAKYTTNTTLAQAWQKYAALLENYKNPDDIAFASEMTHLKTLLAQYEFHDCLSLWFATEFYQLTKQQIISPVDAREGLSHLTQGFTQDTQMFLVTLQQLKHKMLMINTQRSNQFAKVSAIEDVWKQIKNEIIEPLTTTAFIQEFNRAPLVVKIVACDVMRMAIDTIDTTIKTVKISNSVSLNDRIIYFKIMLSDFNQLCSSLLQDIMPQDALKYHHSWPLRWYLERKRMLFAAIMQNSTKQQMFQRSPDFSVNAAMLGSGTAFERHFPETAEDIFMLIHQNSLVAVAGTYDSLFKEKPLEEMLAIPESVQNIIKYVESSECSHLLNDRNIEKPIRIGMQYSPNMIELSYNMSLRNHSSTFQIKYNNLTQQASIAVQFLGEARGRWEQIALLANLSTDISNLELVSDVVLDKKAGITSWEWIIHNQKEFELIMKYVALCGTLSFERNLEIDELASLATIKNFQKNIKSIIATYHGLYSDALINYLMIECENLDYLN